MKILIVYDSRLGAVEKMARLIARGVASHEGCEAVIRRVPNADKEIADETQLADSGDPFASLEDLADCDGLILGSPTRFGNMSHRLKAFLDSTSSLWLAGTLVSKPAAVFTSSSSMHGGQESTLLSMHIPLLHHGMLIVGLPFTLDAVKKTVSGGTPYGASHVAGPQNTNVFTDEEKSLCKALGARVAGIATKLAV
jgi:NAD(P)H dehydrogenase (quinone)